MGAAGGGGGRQLINRAAGFGDGPGKGALLPSENQRGRVAGGLGSVDSRLTRRRGGIGRALEGGPTEAGGDSCAGDDGPEKGRLDGRSMIALSS